MRLLWEMPGGRRLYDIFGAGQAIGGAAEAVGAVGAAEVQANAAEDAANLQYQAENNSLDFNKQVYNTQLSNAQPYLQEGETALGELESETGPDGSLLTPYQSFNAPAPFVAPTAVTDQNDPGYQFALAQGEQALQRGAAAAGGAVTGGTLKAEQKFGQQLGTSQYQQVYNDALGTYNTNYNAALGTYNTNAGNYYTGQTNNFNRLSSLVGVGQTANNQVGSSGAAAASTNANAPLTAANNAGNYLTQGANAGAAGIIGATSAVTNGINNYQNGQLLSSLADQGPTTPSYNDAAGFGLTDPSGGY